ncbi:MAG: glycoside hydrolase family 13 protein [Clostridia bacterium]|nr:glycoside hydrolase family 13 protein [Clostridia bacterium]
MEYYPFDSRNPIYRLKFGAIAAGETLRLRVLLHFDAHCHNVYLMIKNDRDSDYTYIEMIPRETLDNYRFYDCEINREEGLYFYCFKYTSDYGDFFITKQGESLGVVSRDTCIPWQLTVYEKDFKVPEWLRGGIIYQIFPDRFYNSGKIKQNIPDDRYISGDWSKEPEYRQNGDLCSLGNDYYGGDLQGIKEKLPYLKSLGVNCVYLNPIFEAHSNHRYNTADYLKIDSILGDEKDLEQLCEEAENLGIYIILDGVFSHTGDDSIYFNRRNRYGSGGAYNDDNSPYRSWYKFGASKDDYASWWGIKTLPEVEENDPAFTEFITGENGVIRYWLKKGVKGFRLDVADELPDEFLDNIRKAIKTEDGNALLLGEVWEDASNKISYGSRRRFIRGSQLDSVMNYPFANSIVEFVRTGNQQIIANTVMNIVENYPKCVLDVLMNHIGTHDTARILTRLIKGDGSAHNRPEQSGLRLCEEEYKLAKDYLFIAAALQYTLPGVPSLYYGDEAGVQGFGDPFCRATYPWGNEDEEILEFYRQLGSLRTNCDAYKNGAFKIVANFEGVFGFTRVNDSSMAATFVNRRAEDIELDLPFAADDIKQILGGQLRDGKIFVKSNGFAIITT